MNQDFHWFHNITNYKLELIQYLPGQKSKITLYFGVWIDISFLWVNNFVLYVLLCRSAAMYDEDYDLKL